ncbi:MAG: ABC transporter ATP-binding protein [Clostridiales bacterium]|jgi:ATP-binding cassette subfamily B protein|nr:ABC transporter ATP-binding protein [Bacillota bacterium]NLK02799.1 ABC transporter ATP-binding protein [Clostridiales bacterium]
MVKKLIQSIRQYKLPSILTAIFITGEAIIECAIPFITANLINKIQADSITMPSILKTGLLLIGMAVISLCLGGIAGITSAKASAGFAKNLRGDLFSKIQTYSFENIDKFSSASLVTRMTTDINHVQIAYMMIIRTAIRAPLIMMFSIVMAFIMGGKLATSFVIIVPILGFGLFIISQKAMPAFHRVFKKYDRLNESIEENVRAMRVVKGFSREEYEKKKFGEASQDIYSDFVKAERIVAFNGPLMQFCIYFNLIFVLILGSKIIVSSGGSLLGVGEISAMLTYGVQILIQLMMLSMIYVMITISNESIRRIVEVLDEEPSLSNGENPNTFVKDGSIDFENVSFKYSKQAEKYALSDINLHIKTGMTVGIIGGTGSGKSSLIQLIPRLYDVTEGTIRVGGVNVKDYDLTALRDSVSIVLQKNSLFSGTIKDNLLWGNENASDEEIIEACRIAQAHDFISSFPKGYDTIIEQGGTNVSGGQRQRLCIARALLKKPKILILDDSTSAVDTKTDAHIRSGLRDYIPNTSKLIIAQRVASVEDADMIIVLNNGKISATGKHEELLKTSDIYREIYQQQVGRGDDNE